MPNYLLCSGLTGVLRERHIYEALQHERCQGDGKDGIDSNSKTVSHVGFVPLVAIGR